MFGPRTQQCVLPLIGFLVALHVLSPDSHGVTRSISSRRGHTAGVVYMHTVHMTYLGVQASQIFLQLPVALS